MTLVVVLHAAAGAEMTREFEFYRQAREGVIQRFRESVEQAIERAATHPAVGAPSFGGTRALRVKGFPFDVVYRATGDRLVVFALSAHRRRPGYWLSRLD